MVERRRRRLRIVDIVLRFGQEATEHAEQRNERRVERIQPEDQQRGVHVDRNRIGDAALLDGGCTSEQRVECAQKFVFAEQQRVELPELP